MTQVAAVTTPPETTRAQSPWRYCLKVFVAVRAGLFVVGLLSVAVIPWNAPANVPGWPAQPLTAGWHNMFTAWERWDSLWFLRIIDSGYSSTDNSAAFFPGYPLASRIVSLATGGHPLLGAYLVASGALVVALYLIYRLTEFEFDADIAHRTVALVAVFPTALFLFAPYSESLFLALTVAAFYAGRRGHWAAATAYGALATFTRSIGVVLALVLAIEALRQEIERRTAPAEGDGDRPVHPVVPWIFGLGKGFLVGAGSCVGILLYLCWWWWRAGDPLIPFSAQNGWARTFSWPWETLADGTRVGLRYIGITNGGYHTIDLLIVALSIAAAVWVVWRTPLVYKLYTVAYLLFPLFLQFPGRPFMSMPRFVVVLVPLFWAFAVFTRRFRLWTMTVATFAGGLGMLSLLFVAWFWVF